MATTRAVSAGRGFAWLGEAFGLIRRHPAQLLGGAGWVMACVVVVMVVVSVLNLAVQWLLGTSPVVGMLLGTLFWLPALYVFAGLFIGYLRLMQKLDRGESDGSASAYDVFDGLRDTVTTLRATGLALLLMVATQSILVVLVAVLAPDLGRWYLEAAGSVSLGSTQAVPPPVDPEGFMVMFAIMFVLTLFSYTIQGIGLGQLALGDRGVFGAIGDGFKATARNLLPLLALLLGMIALGVVVMLGFLLAVGVIAVAAYFTTQWLFVLAIPLYLLLFVFGIAISYGVAYQLWRDLCGDGAQEPAVAA